MTIEEVNSELALMVAKYVKNTKYGGMRNLNRLVIYCSHCPMWFDTKNGWKAEKSPITGIPICPNCGAPLFEIEARDFYKQYLGQGKKKYEEVMTWEWPNGSYWKPKPKDDAPNWVKSGRHG